MLRVVGIPSGGASLARCVAASQPGGQHCGIAPGGAVDQGSYHKINTLLHGDTSWPAFEWPLLPLQFVVEQACVVMFGGAQRSWLLEVNGRKVELSPYQRHHLPAGSLLRAGRVAWGNYGYLCLEGGTAWHSQSAFVLGPASDDAAVDLRDPLPTRRQQGCGGLLRVLPGPEWQSSLEPWLAGPWVVDGRSDRSAIRLRSYDRRMIEWPIECDIRSGPTVDGVVQLTSQGPMILLRDRGTVGGYARGWVVIREDLDRAGQFTPGQAVRFQLLTR